MNLVWVILCQRLAKYMHVLKVRSYNTIARAGKNTSLTTPFWLHKILVRAFKIVWILKIHPEEVRGWGPTTNFSSPPSTRHWWSWSLRLSTYARWSFVTNSLSVLMRYSRAWKLIFFCFDNYPWKSLSKGNSDYLGHLSNSERLNIASLL